MNRFNPPELRRLRVLLRRRYGAEGSFAEQVEAVAGQLEATPGSRLAFLGRVHRELSLEHLGDDQTSPEAFRGACARFAAELGGEHASVSAPRSLGSWLFVIAGSVLVAAGLDFSGANMSLLAFLGPVCALLLLPVVLGPGRFNPVVWGVAIVAPIVTGYLTDVQITETSAGGALLLQLGLLAGSLESGVRRGALSLIAGLELVIAALVVFALTQGYDLQSAGAFSVLLVALAVFSLVRLGQTGANGP